MSRVFTNLTHLRLIRLPGGSAANSVRFYRKPRWVGVAKSKMYQNLEIKDGPIEEMEEFRKLKENHNIYRKSLWAWQKEAQAASGSHQVVSKQRDEEFEIRRIIHDTEEMNIRVKSRRDQELVEEWVKISEEINQCKLSKKEEEEKKLELAKQQVLTEMEKLKTAVNLEDLDEAIERALSSEVDYNFAIDESGNTLSGRHNNGPSAFN